MVLCIHQQLPVRKAFILGNRVVKIYQCFSSISRKGKYSKRASVLAVVFYTFYNVHTFRSITIKRPLHELVVP